MKKLLISTAVAAALIGASSTAMAEWDIPFFDDDSRSRWDGRGYGDHRGRGDGYSRGRGDGRGRGGFEGDVDFNMNMKAKGDADVDSKWEGEGDYYYDRDRRRDYYRGAPYGERGYYYPPCRCRPCPPCPCPYITDPPRRPAVPPAPARQGSSAPDPEQTNR